YFFMQIITPIHSWVVKKELYDIPLLGTCIRLSQPIAVDRSSFSSVRKIIMQGREKIEKGLSIVIFPDSTRISPKEKCRFKPSAARLAIGNNVPMLLIAHNAGLFWPKGFWMRRSGIINFKIIDVIYPENFLSNCKSESDISSDDKDNNKKFLNNSKMLTLKIQDIINKEKDMLLDKPVIYKEYF
ncbi:MAG TPA: lysophospholipid acyltransferase family protein, partial [Candidatus Megaira endosymbiont of Hartmannula sinica]|nr:lysophospholipid acyltransferase family protein [Candidatus Megaera endosymbiont of Hartmannula sinica]